MIPVPSGVRVWLASGVTDMRRGMNGLALQVQQALGRDPHAGDLYVFRGKRGDLVKILWHDGLGMSLYAKRLERGRFVWPTPVDGTVVISPAQLGYMLEGIDWRNPQQTWRPSVVGQNFSALPAFWGVPNAPIHDSLALWKCFLTSCRRIPPPCVRRCSPSGRHG